jgi:hypothetical protein
MPRLPVDGTKVVEHRITLGGKERQMLESTLTAYSFRNVATPVVTAVNDNTTLLLLAAAVGLAIPTEWLPTDWEEVTQDMGYNELKDWLEIQNLAGAAAGAAYGSKAGWVGAIIGAILGSMGIETAEDLGAEIVGTSTEIADSAPMAFTATMILAQRALREIAGLNPFD